MRRFFAFIFFLAVVAAAFYGGTRYREIRQALTGMVSGPQPTPTPDTHASSFEAKRAAVDADPQKWLAENVTAGSKPLDSKDPEFLYLYGRALVKTGDNRGAAQAFELAIVNLPTQTRAALPLDAEIKIAQAAAALKQSSSTMGAPTQEALNAQRKAVDILDEVLGTKGQAPPK